MFLYGGLLRNEWVEGRRKLERGVVGRVSHKREGGKVTGLVRLNLIQNVN